MIETLLWIEISLLQVAEVFHHKVNNALFFSLVFLIIIFFLAREWCVQWVFVLFYFAWSGTNCLQFDWFEHIFIIVFMHFLPIHYLNQQEKLTTKTMKILSKHRMFNITITCVRFKDLKLRTHIHVSRKLFLLSRLIFVSQTHKHI